MSLFSETLKLVTDRFQDIKNISSNKTDPNNVFQSPTEYLEGAHGWNATALAAKLNNDTALTYADLVAGLDPSKPDPCDAAQPAVEKLCKNPSPDNTTSPTTCNPPVIVEGCDPANTTHKCNPCDAANATIVREFIKINMENILYEKSLPTLTPAVSLWQCTYV